jgi:hypothetical protein
MRKIFTLLSLFLLFSSLNAQNTVGLLSFNPDDAFDSYNLVYPHRQANVYLFNNCGEIVHTWEDSVGYVPGNTAYLLENGDLVKTKRPAVFAGDPIWAGGGGASIEIRDWDNNLKWSYTLNDSMARLHHDIEVMPNGNILAIAWELMTNDEAIANGRDSAKLNQIVLWPDYVLEIEPIDSDSFNILWEWHAKDHLIQDFDSTKLNYGVVSEHPELINFNWETNNAGSDWMHVNSIDYNEDLDQIVISVPTFHEFWIIDHNTSTSEAAGTAGDLLFRWGNPAAYGGDSSLQKSFYQHDVHWIDNIPSDQSNFGKIAFYNNRVGVDYSTVNIIDPTYAPATNSYETENGTFLPADFDFAYQRPDSTAMHSTGLSSFQILPNGNMFICVGRFGYQFELNENLDIVWEYKTPLVGSGGSSMPATQNDTLLINQNLTFRAYKFPLDFPAFDGKDLSPKGYLELNPDSTFCARILPAEETLQDISLRVFPNPASDLVTVQWSSLNNIEVSIFNQLGRRLLSTEVNGSQLEINTRNLSSGIYFLKINNDITRKLIIQQ